MGNGSLHFEDILTLEDDDSTLPQKVGIRLPINTVSYPLKIEH